MPVALNTRLRQDTGRRKCVFPYRYQRPLLICQHNAIRRCSSLNPGNIIAQAISALDITHATRDEGMQTCGARRIEWRRRFVKRLLPCGWQEFQKNEEKIQQRACRAQRVGEQKEEQCEGDLCFCKIKVDDLLTSSQANIDDALTHRHALHQNQTLHIVSHNQTAALTRRSECIASTSARCKLTKALPKFVF